MLLSHTAGITVIISSLLIKHRWVQPQRSIFCSDKMYILCVYFLFRSAYEADTISAMFIAVAICVTMYPLSYHCALILMNATPKELITSIDKCLKEVWWSDWFKNASFSLCFLFQEKSKELSALNLEVKKIVILWYIC